MKTYYAFCINCLIIQSEEDFLDDFSDFDDISIHSASVRSDTSAAPNKKLARRGRKKRKSEFTIIIIILLHYLPQQCYFSILNY